MSNQSQGKSGGITFAGALGLLFIGLKLGRAIAWSWWWVLAPFWLPIAVVAAVLLVLAVVAGVVASVRKVRR